MGIVDGICQLFMAGHIVVVLMGPYFLLATDSLDKCHREAPRDQSTTRLNGVLDFCFHANRGWLKTVFTIKSLRCYRSLTKSTVKDYPLTIRVDDIFPGIVISYGCVHLLTFRTLKNAFRYDWVMRCTFRVVKDGLFGLLYLFKSI